MATCPNCQAENDADFGLVNCISCKMPFMIEIDGEVREAGAAPVTQAPPVSHAPQAAAELTNILIDDLNSNSFESSDSVSTSPAAPSSNEYFDLPTDVPPPIAAAAFEEVRREANEDMREVATFGNSDASTAREGGYRFNLSIYGIDSADIRNDVKDALTDGRFLWDLESLLGQIEQGVLKLNDLSAVKSALIVQRLKTLPVDIKWEQYAIHQS
jgi:hypothetical protein